MPVWFVPGLFLFLLSAKAALSLYSEKTVTITELVVPRNPKEGDDVTLTCRFRLGGQQHRLYTVNWWRGTDQFYTYKKNNYQPKNAYSFKGIDVVLENSTETAVTLRRVSEDTSGTYKCEVMGEGPAFKTAVEKKEMKVIVPPERVEIARGFRHLNSATYQPDERVQLNCTTIKSKPRAQLFWEINSKPVSKNEIYRYPDLEDYRGRVTSSLALTFMAPRHFINQMARVTCTALVEGHEFKAEDHLSLDPSAAYNLYSSTGWKRPICWYFVCILSATVRLWLL